LPVSISLRFTKGHQADERLAASISRMRRSRTLGFGVAPQVQEWFGGCRSFDGMALGGLAFVPIVAPRPSVIRVARAMPDEPIGGESCGLVERAGFLEQVRRAGNDSQLLDAMQSLERTLVELEHVAVVGADDQ